MHLRAATWSCGTSKSATRTALPSAILRFPSGDLVTLTLHIPYPTYAAYFDLGRAPVRRALGSGVR